MLDEVELNRMSIDELDKLYKELLEQSIIAGDNAKLPLSIPGKKLKERLEKDLVAIRSKYMGLNISKEEMMAEFNFNRGREYQILSELNLFNKSDSIAKEINDNMESVSLAIERVKKANASFR